MRGGFPVEEQIEWGHCFDCYFLGAACAGLFDVEKEVARLNRQREKLEKDLAAVQGRVQNRSFMDRAPPAVVAEALQAKEEAEQKVAAIAAKIEQMLALA